MLTLIWGLTFLLLRWESRQRQKTAYWQGRWDELHAQAELAEGGPHLYMLTVRQQLAEHFGEGAARDFVENLQFHWADEEEGEAQ